VSPKNSPRLGTGHAVALTGTLVLGFVISPFTAGPAAAEECALDINFSAPTSVSVEYGEYWEFIFTANQELGSASYPDEIVVTSTNVPSGYAPSFYYSRSTGYAVPGSLSTQWDTPLAPGSYTFSISTSFSDDYTPCDSYVGQTPTPATLTVVPAALGIELRALPDTSNPQGAVVSASLTGDQIDRGFYEGPATPSGSWHFVVLDDSGAVAVERNIERASDDPLGASFYWLDAEPGKTYSVSASFELSGSSAGNFDIADSNVVSYTASESERPTPTSSSAGQPDAHLPAATGFGLPLWLVIVAAILLVGLACLLTVFAVRLRRRPGTSD